MKELEKYVEEVRKILYADLKIHLIDCLLICEYIYPVNHGLPDIYILTD